MQNIFIKTLEELSKKIHAVSGRKEDIAQVVKQVTNISITPDMIHIRAGTVRFTVSPTYKAALLLKKNELLEKLKQFNISTIE